MNHDYKTFAVTLAKEAGVIMLENFKLGMKKEWKSDNSPLTATDTTINALVIQRVKEHFPDHEVLGEEQSSEKQGTHMWVVDPVDGTQPFSHGVPVFVFSLALVVDGESIVGVVYDPIMDRLLAGEKGQGATLNGEPIQVNSADSFQRRVVNIDGPWADTGAPDVTLYSLPQALHEEGARQSKFACQTYGGMLVALGEYTAAICSGKSPWDIAALKVIVEEAGGKVTDLRGNEQRYDKEIYGALISNGKTHEKLVALLKPCLGERS